MLDTYIVHIVQMHARGKPWNGPVTVLTFICPDESRANYLAGEALNVFADTTGLEYNYHVEPLPIVEPNDAAGLIRLAREAASDLT
jgi:hypothetical protein